VKHRRIQKLIQAWLKQGLSLRAIGRELQDDRIVVRMLRVGNRREVDR
jgi:hypothetical protein